MLLYYTCPLFAANCFYCFTRQRPFTMCSSSTQPTNKTLHKMHNILHRQCKHYNATTTTTTTTHYTHPLYIINIYLCDTVEKATGMVYSFVYLDALIFLRSVRQQRSIYIYIYDLNVYCIYIRFWGVRLRNYTFRMMRYSERTEQTNRNVGYFFVFGELKLEACVRSGFFSRI